MADLALKKRLSLWVLVVYWFILFLGTTLPGDQLPETPSGDKFNHFAGYAVLSFLLFSWMRIKKGSAAGEIRLFQKTFLITAIYAVLDEVHQLFIPGRFFEWYDILADINGAVLGLAVAFILTRTFPLFYE